MATPLPPMSYRNMVIELIRAGWQAERNFNLDCWTLVSPTGATITLDRRTLEEAGSAEAAMRVALAKANGKPQPEPEPKLWDGARALDID